MRQQERIGDRAEQNVAAGFHLEASLTEIKGRRQRVGRYDLIDLIGHDGASGRQRAISFLHIIDAADDIPSGRHGEIAAAILEKRLVGGK